MTRPGSDPAPVAAVGAATLRWRLLVAVLIALGGILLSALAWSAMRTTQRAQIEAGLETTVAELTLAFESGFAQQHEHLRDQSRTWAQAGLVDPVRWQADAKHFRELHEECIAIEWDPRTAPGEPLVSGSPEAMRLLASRPGDAAARSVRATAIESGTEATLGPFPGPDGRWIVEILIPVAVGPDSVGVLTAWTDPALALERLAGPRYEEYALEVWSGRTPLFRRGEAAGGELTGLNATRGFRAGGLTSEWTVAVRPGRLMLASPPQLLQWMVLIGGIVLSMLIATTFWVGQVAMLRSRDLFGASVELEERRRELETERERGRRQDERITAAREERRTLLMSMKAEMESRASNHAPDPAVSELETFTYSVSHDLRSPMGAILNYAAVLAEDYRDALGEEGKEYLERITASAQRAIAMMDGLLAYSRAGSQDLKIADVDVAPMIREIHAELAQSRPGRNPALSMGDLPSIRGDPTLLWTLFSNLLSNAHKFTQGVADPQVEVGGYLQGSDVVYYVKDNGIGFDMRHASKLFGVFERLPSGARHEGHGVGLAVVQRIARRHGGDVRAEGVPDKGSTFFVTLPSDPVIPRRSAEEAGTP